MIKIPKEATNILIETGIQMLKIVKEMNEQDQLFTYSKTKSNERSENDNSENPDPGNKENTAVSA